MSNSRDSRSVIVVLVLGMVLVVGCGKKQTPVMTAPPEASQSVSPVAPKPVTPEPPKPPEISDYRGMQPSEMGIDDVFFTYDSHELDDASMRILSQNARILKDHTDVVVVIEGHGDERGTIEYNLALGEKRAKTARDYLVSLGVGVGQLRVTSYGENKPFATGSTEKAWAQNRRAHFARP
jgi:peptidoglycan-associated lipoprotein